jgi:hypothetical protein
MMTWEETLTITADETEMFILLSYFNKCAFIILKRFRNQRIRSTLNIARFTNYCFLGKTTSVEEITKARHCMFPHYFMRWCILILWISPTDLFSSSFRTDPSENINITLTKTIERSLHLASFKRRLNRYFHLQSENPSYVEVNYFSLWAFHI